MKKFLKLLLCLSLSGCATTPNVYVPPSYRFSADALNNGQNNLNKKYLIALPTGKNDPESDLQFMQFSNFIKKGLIQDGATIVNKLDDADIVVTLEYGISDPKEETINYSVPVYGQTGVASGTTNSSFYSNGYVATTTYAPSYGIVGVSNQQETYTYYSKFLRLEAYDLNAFRTTNKKVQVWKITVISAGSSGDLRKVFPVMVVASAPYFGKDTEHRISVYLSIDDPRIAEMKSQ